MNPGILRLCVAFPSDPLGTIPGGIETVIRGIIRWAPEDIQVNVLGVTTDRESRPPGRWTEHSLGPACFRHFPAYVVDDPHRQPRIPATVRYMAALTPRLLSLRGAFDVLEFHRIEPVALFLGDPTPKTAVFHQNMDVLRGQDSDIRWKHMPWLYYGTEGFLMRRLQSVYVVRQDAVAAYQQQYPAIADRFRFTPTWMDPEIFYPVAATERDALRSAVRVRYGCDPQDRLIVSVGRLDRQKNPELMVAAFARVAAIHSDLRLLLIGDGVLRAQLEETVRKAGLAERVLFVGLLPPDEVARTLNAADLFALSSVYEGMPMCVLEALGCGLPVCTTAVGEVGLAVTTGENGVIVQAQETAAFAAGLEECLGQLERLRGEPAIRAARQFVPEKVLAPLYANYRRLAAGADASAAGKAEV